MNTIYIANTLLKRGFLCVAALFLFFFMGCSPADPVPKPPAIPEGATQQLIQLIRNSNPNVPFGITIDTSGDEPVLVLTATNTVRSALDLTVDIKQDAGIITDPSNFKIKADEPIVWGEETINVMVTFSSLPNAFPYTVRKVIEGTPIKDWMQNGTINDFVKASFAGEEGWISLGSLNTINITGLRNANNASNGFIRFTLPSGYIANPSIISLPDPDGQGIDEATIMPIPITFRISEQDRSAITQIYTINPIQLGGFLDDAQTLVDLIQRSNPNSVFEVTVDRTDFSLPAIVLTATNTVESALSATVAINQNEGIITDPSSFTITADNPIVREERTANIMATFDSAAQPISYPIMVVINAAPIERWMTDENIDAYITATFNSQRGMLLLASDNTLSIEGLTNVDNGAEGSISIALPAGFTAVPSIIPLPDPDGQGVDQATITPNPSVFTISENDKSANSQSYTINPIALSVVRSQRLVDLIERSNPDRVFSVSVDKSVDPPIIVLTATNTVESALSFTVAINQDADIITDSPSFTITADNPIVREERTINIMATFDSESSAISYKIRTVIEAVPVETWLTASTLYQYITATFNSQKARLLLDENTKTLSVTGLININNGNEGSINFTLPAGYTADPSSIALPDPDGQGTNQATITPSVTAFTISEDGKAANSQSYTLDAINLAELTGFDPSIHISVVDTTFTERPVENLTFSEENGVITVTGLANALNVDKTYTFTISEIPGIFTTDGGSDIRFYITEPTGSSSGGASLLQNTFTVTNQGENSGTTYSLVVRFSDGAIIANWLDVNTFNTYFTRAIFGRRVATTLRFDGSVIFISGGITNLASGSIGFTSQLPPGYTLSGVDALIDPDGDILVEAVIEGEAGSITITEDRNPDNSESYLVKISLEPYSHSPVRGADVTVTSFFGTQSMETTVDITANVITISSIFNTFGTEGRGSVVITPRRNSYTITPSGPFHFDNPDGTDAETIPLGTIIVETINESVPHEIVVQLLPSFEITITDPNVINNPVTVPSGGTVTMASPCEILPLSSANVTVSGAPTGSMLDGSMVAYYDRASDILSAGKYTIPKTLTIVDGNSVAIDSSFVINVEFPPCDDDSVVSTAFGSGRTGADASTAYQIDNAAKLELVSYLVENSNAAYGSGKFYEITADIDLGLVGLPWSETDSGADGAGFPPIGKNNGTNFAGTLDCNNNTISNLYINRPTTENVGLFGYVQDINMATIKNCALINVKVTGDSNVGGLVGANNASTILDSYATGAVAGTGDNVGGLVGDNNNSTITRSYAEGSVRGASYTGGLVGSMRGSSAILDSYATGTVTGTSDNVGGLVGSMRGRGSSAILDSYATGTVTGTGDNVGGLVGDNNTSNITRSYAQGSVTGGDYVGGVVGQNSNSTITSSYAEGSVTGGDYVGGVVGWNSSSSIRRSSYRGFRATGASHVGGVVGWNSENSIILDSYATGEARGHGQIGGLVGYNDKSTVENSHATGSVYGAGTINDVGGLIGKNYSSIVKNSYATGNIRGTGSQVGGLIGWSGGDALNGASSIENSYTTGDVTGTRNNVGGLIGYNFNSTITNSYAEGSVSGGTYFRGAGGLIGYNNNSTVENSYAIGNVKGSANAGGLVGWNFNSTFKNSYATGSVYGAGGLDGVGGLIGYNFNSTVENSYATGNVRGTGNNVGGLVGDSYGSISIVTNSYATGTVFAGKDAAGGLVGKNRDNSQVAASYATGSVTARRNIAGGLVGLNYKATVKDSYATGTVEGNNDVGGLIGWNVWNVSSIGIADYNVINSYTIGNVTARVDLGNTGFLIGKNSLAQASYEDIINNRFTFIYTNVLDSYFNSDANVQGASGPESGKGVGSDDINNPATITGGVTGLSVSELKVAKGTTSGSTYNTWLDAVWNFTAGQYPRLKTVACANHQYASPVPDTCTTPLQ